MSIFEQYKNSRQLWIITALVLVLLGCVGVLAWLTWGAPASAKPPSSSQISSEQPASSAPVPSSSSKEPSSSSKPSSSASSAPASSSSRAPASSSVSSASPAPAAGSLTVSRAGTYDTSGTYGGITVTAAGVTLKNKTVTGDLILSSSIADGAITLENVTVKGTIQVFGGKSIVLNDVTAAALTAQRAGGISDYQIKGASTIQIFTAKNRLTLDEGDLDSGYAGVRNLITASGAPVWQDVTLTDGALDSVTTTATTQLNLAAGTSVTTVDARAKTHIAGSGRVGELKVGHDEVSYEREPGDITVGRGYNDPVMRSWGIGESDPSEDDDDDDPVQLATPANLRIAAGGAGQAVLSFDSVAHATGYTIHYTLTNGSTTASETVSVSSAGYTLAHALIGQQGTSVSFQARAISSSSRYTSSAFSAAKSASVVKLAAPQNLLITPAGDGKFTLSFNAVTGARGYSLTPYVGTAAQSAVALASDVLSYTFDARYDEITAETAYHFTVKAVGDAALALDSDGSTSSTHTVSPLAAPTGLSVSTGEGARAGKVVFAFHAHSGAEYNVTASFKGTPLTLSAGDNCTISPSGIVTAAADGAAVLLADAPGAVAAGDEYLLTVTALGNGLSTLDSTAALTVAAQRRATPAGLSVTSSATDSVTFDFAEVTGVSYSVAAALDGSPLTLTDGVAALGDATADGQTFTLSVTALGDGVLYTDSVQAEASAPVGTLTAPDSLQTALLANGKLELSFAPSAHAGSHRLVPSVQSGGTWQVQTAITSFDPETGERLSAQFAVPAGATGVRFTVQALSASALWVDSAAASSDETTVTDHAAPLNLSMAAQAPEPGVVFSFEKPASAPAGTVYDLVYTTSLGSVTVTNAPVSQTVSGVSLASVTGFTVTAQPLLSSGVFYRAASHAAVPLAAPAVGESPVTDTTVPNPDYTEGSGLPETLAAVQFAFTTVPHAQSYTLNYTTEGGGPITETAVTAAPFTVVTDAFSAADVVSFTVSANRVTIGSTTYLASAAGSYSAT